MLDKTRNVNVSKVIKFLIQLFEKGGLASPKAESIARILVEADLLGHRTHGLALVKNYFEELEKGGMESQKEYEVLNFTSTTQLWNGNYQPGTWLVEEAIEVAAGIAKNEGIGTIVIQKSHHIGCLAAYLEAVTAKKLMITLACSDPRNKTVAPFGGLEGVYSPNPIAMGIPTQSIPILLDVSMSTTANAVVARAAKNKEFLGGDWLLDKNGNATNDPSLFFQEPPASLLPLGGLDLGYKGFALGIMIEAMTNALGGYGRSDEPTRWGASVFLQVIDPEKFSGESYFLREMESFRNASIHSKLIDKDKKIRMPGERGLELKKKQLKNGLEISNELINELNKLGEKYQLNLFE